MAFQPSVDSFGISRLGFKCSWWHPRQANDALPSESSNLAKITIINVFPCSGEHVRTYISGSRCAWWQKTTNRHKKKKAKQSVPLPLSGHAIRQGRNARALSGPMSQCNATSWSRARNSQVDWQNLLSMWCGHPKSHLGHSWYEGTASYFAPQE